MGSGIGEMSAWQLFKAGGPIMYPLLLCSLFALTILIEKFLYFQSIKTDVLKMKRDVFELIKINKIKEAVLLCDTNKSPVAKIFKAGLLKFGHSREEIKESIEDASLLEIPKLENRLSMLATIAHISPLLGLLGTVTGIASSFYIIQMRVSSMNPITLGDLAAGMGQALLTTMAGLMIAIPTFVAYNYCVNYINNVILDMERSSAELVNFMCQIIETNPL